MIQDTSGLVRGNFSPIFALQQSARHPQSSANMIQHDKINLLLFQFSPMHQNFHCQQSIRSKFLRIQEEGEDNQLILSKHHYLLKVEQPSAKVILGIHQQDVRGRIRGSMIYIDVGFVIMKVGEDGVPRIWGSRDQIEMRECFMECLLEQGEDNQVGQQCIRGTIMLPGQLDFQFDPPFEGPTHLDSQARYQNPRLQHAQLSGPECDLTASVYKILIKLQFQRDRNRGFKNQRDRCHSLGPNGAPVQGEYIIIPKTTGCTLQVDQQTMKPSVTVLAKLSKEPFPHQVITLLKDLFDSFDLNLNGNLTYQDFMLLYLGATGHQLSEQDFKNSIINQFEQNKPSLSFNGFMLLIRSIISAKGPQALIAWLTNLGFVYSHELQTFVTERSRLYALTIHSKQQLVVTSVDTLLEDQEPEFDSTEQQIMEQGREIYSNGALKMHCSFHENINVYQNDTYLIDNSSKLQYIQYPIIACIDLSDFAGVVQTSTQSLIRQKTIEPREKAFMFHAKIVDAEFKDPLRPMISYRKV